MGLSGQRAKESHDQRRNDSDGAEAYGFILSAIDAEISRLKQVKAILASAGPTQFNVSRVSRRKQNPSSRRLSRKRRSAES